MKKTLFMCAVLMLAFCVSAFPQNYEKKKNELAQLCNTKVLAEDLDNYIRHSKNDEIAITVTNTTDKNLIEIIRAINSSPKPVSIILLSNDGFTKLPDNFLFVSEADTCRSLKNIILPSELQTIGFNAFKNCVKVENILFQGKENKLTEIGYGSFENCYKLQELELIEDIEEIDMSFMKTCTALRHIIIPKGYASEINWEGTTEIGGSAFDECKNLLSISIPEGVTNLHAYMFYGCSGLTSITIPQSVNHIGCGAFLACNNLTSITILADEAELHDEAFDNCPKLKSIYVTEHLYEKYHQKFFPKMKINVKDNQKEKVTKIEKEAFGGDTTASIIIPESVIKIGNFAFEGCTNLTSITITENVSEIGDFAFDGCTSLASVSIPNSVREIGFGAFRDCTNLISITIPESVKVIGRFAFDGCDNLESIFVTKRLYNKYHKDYPQMKIKE